jgi:hypothetical protein
MNPTTDLYMAMEILKKLPTTTSSDLFNLYKYYLEGEVESNPPEVVKETAP